MQVSDSKGHINNLSYAIKSGRNAGLIEQIVRFVADFKPHVPKL